MSNTYTVKRCNLTTGETTLVTINRTWQRFNPPNPYTSSTHTTQELNMRRKAEILQYKNKQSTSNTSSTKNMIFSRIANSKRFTNRATNNICENIKKPSSASNVPGKLPLFFNSSVPLTRFGSPLRTYM